MTYNCNIRGNYYDRKDGYYLIQYVTEAIKKVYGEDIRIELSAEVVREDLSKVKFEIKPFGEDKEDEWINN